MAEHLKRFRAYPIYQLQPAEFKPIQEEVLAWIDTRVKAGENDEQMNRELESAGLLSKGAEDVNDFEKSYAGFLGEVEVRTKGISPDVVAVTFGTFTGSFCGYDNTAVLYTRKPFRRLARINAERSFSHGYRLRQLAVGKDDAGRGRMIGSEWVASNCTSNWNGNIFRIDLLRARAVVNVLNRGVGAFGGDDVGIDIKDDTVTLRYTTMTGETADLLRPGIARYRVQDRRAVRQAPVAASYGGFIDEWLELDDADAAPWSTPEAAMRHHDLHAMANPGLFEWAHAAGCPGSPPTREIAIRWGEPKRTIYFLIGGSSAAEMKMLSVSDQHSFACREIDIGKDRSGITAEPIR